MSPIVTIPDDNNSSRKVKQFVTKYFVTKRKTITYKSTSLLIVTIPDENITSRKVKLLSAKYFVTKSKTITYENISSLIDKILSPKIFPPFFWRENFPPTISDEL